MVYTVENQDKPLLSNRHDFWRTKMGCEKTEIIFESASKNLLPPRTLATEKADASKALALFSWLQLPKVFIIFYPSALR
jgi:hypothetical protein